MKPLRLVLVVGFFLVLGGGLTAIVAANADHAGEATQINDTSDFTIPEIDLGESGFDFQATTEQITGYSLNLDVRSNGDMRVTEVIDYQFGVVPKHGIFRDVVVRERYDDRYDRVYPFDLVSVSASEGTPDDVELSEEGNFRRIRIGDPDTTITGQHRYQIVYDLEGVITGFEDHDELFWDAIGAEWTVPIQEAVVTVTMPGEITDIRCFAGGRGSQQECGGFSSEGDTATFSHQNLGSSQGLTVVAGVDTGLIDDTEPILDERWSLARAFSVNGGTMGTGAGLAVLAVGGVALLIHRRGRDRRFVGSATDAAFGNQTGAQERVPLRDSEQELIPVEFVPPDGIRPGQLGTLVDEVAHPVDVTATIVDLASRGYLRIEETEGHKQNWRFVKLKEPEGELLEYEQILFQGLFPPGGRTDVTLGQLQTKFHTHLQRVQNALYDDLVERGWYSRRPDRVRAVWYGIGIAALLAAGGLLAVLIIWTHWALVGIPLVIAALVLLIGARWMPSRSPAGTGMLRRVLGFRRFIEESEADRARFAEQKHLFTEYLPYAVALGATEKWAKAFAGLGEEPPQPSWYVGHQPWNMMLFAHTMNDFSVSTSGTMTSVPASSGGSSGFSGGGGVGGGGGGGGGGSW